MLWNVPLKYSFSWLRAMAAASFEALSCRGEKVRRWKSYVSLSKRQAVQTRREPASVGTGAQGVNIRTVGFVGIEKSGYFIRFGKTSPDEKPGSIREVGQRDKKKKNQSDERTLASPPAARRSAQNGQDIEC